MFPKWQVVAVRCPVSMSAEGGRPRQYTAAIRENGHANDIALRSPSVCRVPTHMSSATAKRAPLAGRATW